VVSFIWIAGSFTPAWAKRIMHSMGSCSRRLLSHHCQRLLLLIACAGLFHRRFA
jgi:hypothetical protein